MGIRILLADDHSILRDGLRLLIEGQPDMEVVGEAGSGKIAVSKAFELKPDVIVMDVSMPDMSGTKATRKIIAKMPDVKILALSMHSEREYVTDMIKAGVSGYLQKECVADELIQAIHTIVEDETYLSPKIAGVVVGDYVRDKTDGSLKTPLTDREREVLVLLANGKNTKEVALELHISTKTVDSHRRQIMDKLDLYSLPELTKYAIRCGLTSVE